MYSLNSIKLRDYYFFKNAEFHFNEGISFCIGENGSGKSLLFSVIPTLLSTLYVGKEWKDWEKPPVGSDIELDFNKDADNIRYSVATNSSAKHSFFLNNEDMHPHKIADAANLLGQYWRIPKELFQSIFFVRGIDKHALSIGTPGERSQWLSKALDLTAVYDAYAAEIDSNIRRINDYASRQSVLNDELAHAQSRMPDSSISAKKYKKAARWLKRYAVRSSAISRQIQDIENAIRIIDKLSRLKPSSKSVEELDETMFKQKAKLESLKSLQKRRSKIEEDMEFNAQLQASMKRLKAKGFISSKFDIELEEEKLAKMDRIVSKFEDDMQAYNQQRKEYPDLERWQKAPTQTKSLEEAEQTLSALVYRHNMREDLEEQLTSLGPKAKKCPTCGNKLTKDHVHTELKKVRLELKVLPDEIKRLKNEVKIWKLKSIEVVAKPQKPSFSSNDYENLSQALQDNKKYRSLKASLREVETLPDNVDTLTVNLQEKYAKLTALKRDTEAYHSLHAMLPEYLQTFSLSDLVTSKRDALQTNLERLREEQLTASDTFTKASNLVNQYQTQVKLRSQYESQVARLKDEIAACSEQTKDLAAWKALQQAFGNSGVRLFQIKESAAVLSKTLTELSSLFFNTTYYFDIQVAPHKLNVMVERKGKIGSVKTLSGAETRSWNLLSAMALMRILPSSMRFDTMILDEVEANMSQRSRDRYVQEVLPELRTFVPKIVVVSPLMNGELKLTPDYSYRIVNNRVNGQFISTISEN